MSKVTLGPQTMIYPNPALLVGANVHGEPNFMAVAWGGIANSEPPMISVAIRHQRHTYIGVRENMTFSVNVPSIYLMKETDYCGIISGKKADKVKVCNFNVFYGKLKNAPLIEQCPINLECTVVHMLNLGSHSLIIGKIEETHISESCLTDGKPDATKIKPIIYTGKQEDQYRIFGEVIGKAHSIGLELKAKE